MLADHPYRGFLLNSHTYQAHLQTVSSMGRAAHHGDKEPIYNGLKYTHN
jgi:hypothetical protein